VFLFWTEENSGQSMFGLSGQKYAPDGTRQWTSAGATIVPLGPREISQVNNVQLGDGAVVAWAETVAFGNQPLHAARIDGLGWVEWSVPACTVASGKSRTTSALTADGAVLLGWSDGRDDAGDVYLQRLNADGTLGAAPCPGDVDGGGDVGFRDLLAVLASWGPCAGCPEDVDGNGGVGFEDLLIVLAEWGPCA
jgi:hypothetical protein